MPWQLLACLLAFRFAFIRGSQCGSTFKSPRALVNRAWVSSPHSLMYSSCRVMVTCSQGEGHFLGHHALQMQRDHLEMQSCSQSSRLPPELSPFLQPPCLLPLRGCKSRKLFFLTQATSPPWWTSPRSQEIAYRAEEHTGKEARTPVHLKQTLSFPEVLTLPPTGKWVFLFALPGIGSRGYWVMVQATDLPEIQSQTPSTQSY